MCRDLHREWQVIHVCGGGFVKRWLHIDNWGALGNSTEGQWDIP